MTAAIIDAIGFVVAGLCAVLLFRTAAKTRAAIVFWTGVCFVWLAANSLLAVIDSFTDADLDLARGATGAAGVSVLLIALLVSAR